jgi:F420-non-reducing hydrogenase small subunit
MTVKVASEWLNSCSGCEISIIDMGERLLDVLQVVEIVHLPALMDSKYFGQMGDQDHLDIPKADVGIISGGIRNKEHLEVALKMRERCSTIIALGTCATHGGIPALTNSYTNDETLERCFHTESTDTDDSPYPDRDIPALLETCRAVDEVVQVDLFLPGCPPHPDHIFTALTALVNGESPELPDKSVCDTCPTIRKGKGELKTMKRFLTPPEYGGADEPLDRMRCLLEQGYLCMGPVTRAGCGGDAILPRCISARVPCRGCYGPVRQAGNQRLDMLNALASNGIDIMTLPETASLLRFSGGHGLLRPKFKKKES